jgi:hypothetical protein
MESRIEFGSGDPRERVRAALIKHGLDCQLVLTDEGQLIIKSAHRALRKVTGH